MSNFEAFVKDLYTFADDLAREPEPLLRAANYLIDNLPDEPQTHHESGRENRWDSPKQIRWYYWKVRTGGLKNPYERTHRLINSFVTSKIRNNKDGASITVFSNYPKAVFVIGDAGVTAETAAVHEGRWWEFDAEVERLSDATLNELDTYLTRAMHANW